MGLGAFSLEQLMELAGFACAVALERVYGTSSHPRVLVCCGPGNQGGDGLVAARHLNMFGYKPTIYLPKPGSKDHYKRLQTQCDNLNIPTFSSEADLKAILPSSDVVLDAIFGFSFKPPIRPPFDMALKLISDSNLPIVSVDIPSGWDVDKGNIHGVGLEPSVLVSLTAPKAGSKCFNGRHFLGGRFVPWEIAKNYDLNLPEYPGVEQVVEI